MNTENSKLKITEKEFNTKLALCSYPALVSAITSLILVGTGVPLVLSKLKFLRITLEVRLITGIFSGVTVGYFCAKNKRLKCMEEVEKNYTYYQNV